MDYKHIIVERKEHLLIVRLNRPEVLNALHPYIQLELGQVFNEFEDDPNMWVAILTAVGEKAFSAGADLKWAATTSVEKQREAYEKVRNQAGYLIRNFRITKPLIAAVNGLAYGGGFELALSCDLIIAAENATFCLPEPVVGRVPSGGGIHRLVRQIPYHVAMDILFTRKRMSAQEGVQLGFVKKVVPFNQLIEEAEKIANLIMEGSPLAIRTIKQMANDGLEMTLKEALFANFPLFTKFLQSHDFREGPKAFSEKRKPVWKGT
ncbi:MAG: enoyl-CoA hydratase/isomerase family protein [Candidatus Lokiarchaeota archaeon]|nr:enoyl-CoA hydratase/isomerase family protein [Candidatus Lokiarchaeota archaeon]